MKSKKPAKTWLGDEEANPDALAGRRADGGGAGSGESTGDEERERGGVAAGICCRRRQWSPAVIGGGPLLPTCSNRMTAFFKNFIF